MASSLKPKALRNAALTGAVVGIVLWGTLTVLAAVMLVSMGAWPLVVWPFAFYWWTEHINKTIKAYNQVVKPQKWEQNVVVNVYPPEGLTGEQVAEAASRAVNEKLQYQL